MKFYKAVYKKGKTKGIFNISLVKKPAMKELFVALSEQEKKEFKERKLQFKTIDEKEHMLIGLVLEPNKPVYRNENGEEFYIEFDEKTVKELAYNFFKQNYHQQTSIEHGKDAVKGVTFVESWTVLDPEKDKSTAYGMELSKGSWVVGLKIDDEELWKKYIETGDVQGFSVDGLIGLSEIKENEASEVKMNAVLTTLKDVSDKLLIALKLKKENGAEVKFGEIEMEGGDVIFEYEGEVLEAGINIFAVDPTDKEIKVPVPAGKYPLADGRILVVTEEGIVGEVMEKGDGKPSGKPEAVEAGDDKEQAQQIKSILIKYDKQEKVLAELMKSIDSIQKDIKEIGLQDADIPAGSGVNHAKIELNGTGRILEAIRNSNQN